MSANTPAAGKTATASGAGPTKPTQELRGDQLHGMRFWREVGWRYIATAVVIVYAMIPVMYIISASLDPIGSVSSATVIPQTFRTVNYEELFTNPSRPFPTWFMNTLIVAVVVVVVQIFASALAAYAFPGSASRVAGVA